MNTTYAIGLMSGSSMDGLDMAYCKYNYAKGKWDYDLIACSTALFPQALKVRLMNAHSQSGFEIARLHTDFGTWCGLETKNWISENQLQPAFICSHGHTVFHQPLLGFSLQIGSGSHLAFHSGVPTVCDFRMADVAAGGQGAPLVPVGEKLLFDKYDGFLNLGGIANLSVKDSSGYTRAWDIGPLNQVLNHIANRAGLEYDDQGKLAARGSLIPDWYQYLINAEYFKKEPPKSLANEYVRKHFIETLPDKNAADLAHTFCKVMAKITADEITKCHPANILVTGGGAFHLYFMELLRGNVLKTIKITVPDQKLINYKEAIIFGFLGVLRANLLTNSVASVTGAIKDMIGGAVYLP